MTRASSACLAIAFTLTGCAPATVARVVDGRVVEGRFVSPRAYAYYARGAVAEARGDLHGALRDYEAAVDEDDSAELWTKLGAVRCALLGAAGEGVADAWRRAEAVDPEYEPLWRARARCELGAGHVATAVTCATRAIAIDPDQVGASLALADALEQAGRAADARRLLDALVARTPGSIEAWRALRALADRAGDAVAVARADAHLRSTDRAAPLPADRLAALDAALVAGDVDRARRLALAARLPLADASVRAAALARPAAARAIAELVLAADPTEPSARVALLAAADLDGDLPALGRAADAALRDRGAALPPLARLVLAEVLARRVDRAAARAVLPGAAHADRDPLFDAVARRLRARLDAGG